MFLCLAFSLITLLLFGPGKLPPRPVRYPFAQNKEEERLDLKLMKSKMYNAKIAAGEALLSSSHAEGLSS